jgi:hypothetical protein
VRAQRLEAPVQADGLALLLAELHGADGGEVLGVAGHDHQVLGVDAVGKGRAPLLPHLGDVHLPGVHHSADEGVGAAEQQNVRPQRVAAREHGEVLLDDRLEERGHQLFGRHALLLQAVDIRLGEHPALARDRVQLDAAVSHVAQLGRRDVELGVDLVDHRAGPARALVVHGRDLLLAAGLGVLLEDDDLGVLAAQLDHAVGLREELLHGQRDGGHLLDELRAEVPRQRGAPRARDEDADVTVRRPAERAVDRLEELERLLRLLGLVALVVLPDDLVGKGVDDHGLHRGRADIEADAPADVHAIRPATCVT